MPCLSKPIHPSLPPTPLTSTQSLPQAEITRWIMRLTKPNTPQYLHYMEGQVNLPFCATLYLSRQPLPGPHGAKRPLHPTPGNHAITLQTTQLRDSRSTV